MKKIFFFILIFLSQLSFSQFKKGDQYLGGGLDANYFKQSNETIGITLLHLKFADSSLAKGFTWNLNHSDSFGTFTKLNYFHKKIYGGNGNFFWGLHKEAGIGIGVFGEGVINHSNSTEFNFYYFERVQPHVMVGAFCGIPMNDRWVITGNLNNLFLFGANLFADKDDKGGVFLKTSLGGNFINNISINFAYRLNK